MAVISVLKAPVGPERNRERSTGTISPKGARKIAARRGTVIVKGASSKNRREVRIARARSSPMGGLGNK
jgi:hypothetical protein